MAIYHIDIEIGEYKRDYIEWFLWEPEEDKKQDEVYITIKRKDNWEVTISPARLQTKWFCNRAAIDGIVEDITVS